MGPIFFLSLGVQAQSLGPDPSPTNLTLAVTGRSLVLSWPSNYIGWALQAQTNIVGGLSTNWATISGTDQSNIFTTPIDQTNASVFFRLPPPQGEMQLQTETGLAVPHLATRNDGTTWLTWYEPVGQNYRLRLQRMNAGGRGLLGTNGVMASSVDQSSWVMDYSLTTDSNGNAILVWSNTKDFTLRTQQFDAQGTPGWGASGVVVNSTGTSAFGPQCLRCSNGDLGIAWLEQQGVTNRLCLTRMKTNGVFAWGTPFAMEIPTNSVGLPAIVQAAGGSVILVWVENAAFDGPGDAYAQQIDETGAAVWPASVHINRTWQLPYMTAPYLVADGSGGLFAGWTEATLRNGMDWFEGRVQHVDENGGLLWAAEGQSVSTSSTTMQLPSAITYLPGPQRVVVAWKETDQSQSLSGINAQAFDTQADPLWAGTGLVIVQTNASVAGLAAALRPTPAGAALFFAQESGWGMMSAQVASLPGQSAASPIETTLSSILSNKVHPCVSDLVNGGYWLVWEDSRGGLFGAFWLAQ
jgi:hypothetical protein